MPWGWQASFAQEAGSLTYSPRCTLLATLPHRDPGDVPLFIRHNGAYSLFIQPGWDAEDDRKTPRYLGYPYGSIPRLILAWLTNEAVRTKSKILGLGDHLIDFMRELGLGAHGGPRGDITRLKNQMERLFGSRLSIQYYGKQRKECEYIQVANRTIFFWDPIKPDDESRQHKIIELGDAFYQEIIDRPVPLDMRVLQGLKRSPMALDIYSWLTYRMSYLKKPTNIPWPSLQLQFGSQYKRARAFREKFREQLNVVRVFYPQARTTSESNLGLLICPSRPQVLKKPEGI